MLRPRVLADLEMIEVSSADSVSQGRFFSGFLPTSHESDAASQRATVLAKKGADFLARESKKYRAVWPT